MTKGEIIKQIFNSDIFNKWHFFKYHFEFYKSGLEHPLAKSIIDAIINIEKAIPNAGKDYLKKIANINSKENETAHYDQLLQVLAELLIVNKTVTHEWDSLKKIEYEPKSSTSQKNPEIIVTTDNLELAIEVKSPEFVKKHNERADNPTQLPSRSDLIKAVDTSKTMLPRDNVVKDFLISANSKFEGFKNDNPNIYCVLVIVWDDFIYEPISAISSPQAGLFTQDSFAKDKQGTLLKFENVDCVIITRHLLPIKNGTRDELLPDLYQHPLDYGRKDEFPFKVMITNPNSELAIPQEMVDCFQTKVPNAKLGAEYLPIDIIHWNK
ncbi:hypothetical protein [Kordia jejudonensis]|uniref:hypothetical protein n=1 Tax=Kordia jejudonensis TaxID=1348245 RepID=UPI0006290AEA|nr:hypothetical protein [Kordia jejudonensis]